MSEAVRLDIARSEFGEQSRGDCETWGKKINITLENNWGQACPSSMGGMLHVEVSCCGCMLCSDAGYVGRCYVLEQLGRVVEFSGICTRWFLFHDVGL